uniref:ANK_REP_REGION domain-containing protein n=1 Tax=Macrostomum lignano TaxID=282301 RepID=A0A1I8FKM3_9PLAT
RDKWSDALMAMLNESLSKEMQAVINLIGSDMRSRAVAAGVATNLTDAQLGFQSTLLSHFQKAITFIYGATAEAGRPSEQSVRNTCRQQLKHGGDRLKGRSHRTGSQLLSGVQTQSPASDSAVQRQSLVAATPSPASGSAVQRQSLVAATQSPASGSAVQRQSLVAATPSPASGSAVQRQSLVAATPSPASQRRTVSGGSDSTRFWQRRTKTVSGGSDSKPRFWQRRTKTVSGGSDSKTKTVSGGSDSSPLLQRRSPATFWQRQRQSLVAATPSPASGSAVQRRSLVAATQSPASGSAVQSSGAATQSPASGSAVQRRSLVAATQSPASGSAVQRHSHSSSFSLQYPVGHHDRPSKKPLAVHQGAHWLCSGITIADVVPRVPVEALFELRWSSSPRLRISVDELHRDEARVHSWLNCFARRPERRRICHRWSAGRRQAPLKPQPETGRRQWPKSRLMISVIGTPAYSSSWPRSSQIDVMNELGFLIRPTGGQRERPRRPRAAFLAEARLLAGVGAGASVTELNLHT